MYLFGSKKSWVEGWRDRIKKFEPHRQNRFNIECSIQFYPIQEGFPGFEIKKTLSFRSVFDVILRIWANF
jgi:hypothetical protein